MTQEEMRRLIDELSKHVPRPTPSQMYAQPVYQPQGFEPDVRYHMEERSWIKKMFEDAVFASSQESDRHPRHTDFTRPRRRAEHTMVSAWATAQASQLNEPAELTTGDTSQLDDFLGGFAKQEV